jgi:hypothetical protein
VEFPLLQGVTGEIGVDGIFLRNEPNRFGGCCGFFGFGLGCLGFEAGGLEFAELFEGAVELAGEALLGGAEGGESAGLLGEALGDRDVVERGREEVRLERGDAAQAPGGVGERLDQVFFEYADGLDVVEEAAAVELIGGGVLGGQDGGAAEEAVTERILRAARFRDWRRHGGWRAGPRRRVRGCEIGMVTCRSPGPWVALGRRREMDRRREVHDGEAKKCE